MKINLTNIPWYLLTLPNSPKTDIIHKEFNDIQITNTYPTPARELGGGLAGKIKSGTTGHSHSLNIALQSHKSRFVPFMLVEDDITKTEFYSNILDYPEDADIVYIGISRYGLWKLDKRPYAKEMYLAYDNINENLVKTYNMLASHAMLICSPLGALVYQKAVSEAFYTGLNWDLYLALQQPYCSSYALKQPFMFQGGQRKATYLTLPNQSPLQPNIAISFAEQHKRYGL